MALYCIVLYSIALYCTVLHCTVLHCTVLYCIVLYCIVLHCIALHCTVPYCNVLCTYTMLHCTLPSPILVAVGGLSLQTLCPVMEPVRTYVIVCNTRVPHHSGYSNRSVRQYVHTHKTKHSEDKQLDATLPLQQQPQYSALGYNPVHYTEYQ